MHMFVETQTIYIVGTPLRKLMAHTGAVQAGDFVLVCIYIQITRRDMSVVIIGNYFVQKLTGGYSCGLSFKEHTISYSSTYLSPIDSCYYPSFKNFK